MYTRTPSQHIKTRPLPGPHTSLPTLLPLPPPLPPFPLHPRSTPSYPRANLLRVMAGKSSLIIRRQPRQSLCLPPPPRLAPTSPYLHSPHTRFLPPLKAGTASPHLVTPPHDPPSGLSYHLLPCPHLHHNTPNVCTPAAL